MVSDTVPMAAAAPLAAAATPTIAGAHAHNDRAAPIVDDAGAGRGWLPWLLLGLGILALIVLLSRCGHQDTADVAPVAGDTAAVAPMAVVTPAPIPTGAGIVSETRTGKPAVIVYFDTAKAAVAPEFAAAAAPLKDLLASTPGAKLAVSGFNDPTGNAAANAALSKKRAQAVKAALVAAGIDAAAVDLVKPAETTDTSGNNANARRVEVTVQ